MLREACPSIAVINAATTPLGVDLTHMIEVMQHFVVAHYAPHWGRSCMLRVVPDLKSVQPADWAIAFLDTADVEGALGYHELTPGGQPLAKVFVKTSINNGESPSSVFSHELFEMLGDPMIQMMAVNNNTGDIVAYENADPVEETKFVVDGVEISNFVLPAWFESFHAASSTRFDFLEQVSAPFQLLSGGYVSIVKDGNFTEVFGSLAKKERFAKEDRRDHRTEFRKKIMAKALVQALGNKKIKSRSGK